MFKGVLPFELRNNSDDSVLYKHNRTSPDYETGKFHTDSLTLPLPFGEIRLTQWVFNNIWMSYSEYEFKKPVVLNWKGHVEMVTMYFNLQGNFSIQLNNMSAPVYMTANQHNMFYGKKAGGKLNMEEFKMKAFMIQFPKNTFFQIANEANDVIKRFAEYVSKGKSVVFSENNLNIDLSIQNCINSIINCEYSDSLKQMFYYSKVIELLVLQTESFNKSLNPKRLYLKNDYDKERILFARDYLIQNIDSPPTLAELSRIAGINEFKLKRGFKEIFSQSVFEYLSDVRLEIAKNELLEKRKSITEIAFDLGYCSLQHFSSSFKKKFGITPSKVF